MSWFSDNYEKAALGGAAVVSVAFAFIAYSNKDAVEESFTLSHAKHSDDVSIPGLPKIKHVKASLESQHIWPQSDMGSRKVDLMIGVPLFAKRGDPDHPVDLLKSASVHSEIPNTWWLENNLDPGYSDSPERDPDKDGFSNREEYVAQTDPNAFKSHPDPVSKLVVSSVKTTYNLLKPSPFGGGKYKFKLQNYKGRDRNKMGMEPITDGQVIPFTGELMKDRFKKAQAYLKFAQQLNPQRGDSLARTCEEEQAHIVSRIYYAMYHAAQAIVVHTQHMDYV